MYQLLPNIKKGKQGEREGRVRDAALPLLKARIILYTLETCFPPDENQESSTATAVEHPPQCKEITEAN